MNKIVLNQIKQKALEEKIPIIMDETLEVLKEVFIKSKYATMLEIGTAVGYSAICFSQYIEKIDTIEKDELRANQAISNIKQMELQENINVLLGDAIEILPNLNKKYDVIFIDAAKSKYPFFLEQALRLINNNGIIVADNILYKGYVLGDYNKHKQRTAVRNLREFICKLKENKNLDVQILEVGDGLAICKYKI